jgi:hypothetical protein
MKGAMNLPARGAGSTLRFQGTGIADGCIGSVFRLFCRILSPREVEWVTSRAHIHILDGIIREPGRPIIGPMLILPIEEWNVSVHACIAEWL